MRLKVVFIQSLISFLITLPFHACSQLLIVNTTVVDVESKKLLTGMDVLINKGIIKEIGSSLRAPSGVKVIDGKGKYLSPGFVDSHVHFFQAGSVFTRPDDPVILRGLDWKTADLMNSNSNQVLLGLDGILHNNTIYSVH